MVMLAGVAAAVAALLSGTLPFRGGAENARASLAAECDHVDTSPSGQKAFATAEGFGRFARGGRGGIVIPVTTLSDTGEGSLRACAEASGPRTCVFRVSGTIAVDDWISVKHPYLTIAGQTSPGGIAIRIRNSPNAPMLVQTHDVVIRHLRLRPGPSTRSSDNVDTIQISGGAHDVILDHVSTSWPTDEGINIVGSGEKPSKCGETRDISVQWSILSEGLNRSNREPHSRGTYFGYGARDISFHHNLIASNVRRNPLINTRGQFDMVNNVIYNSQRYNGEFYTRFGAVAANVIGNVAILGPSSEKNSHLYLVNYFRDYPADFAIYLKDNVDLHRPANRGDERLVLEPGDWRYARSVPTGKLSLGTAAITGPGQAYRDVLAFAGATRPTRDAVDRRVANDVATCRGAIIDDPAQVGGWPTLAGPQPPADHDNDGMADEWEKAHGLSPADPADRNRGGKDGFTALEQYLGDLAGDNDPQRAAAGPDPDPTCGFAVAQAPPLPEVTIRAEPDSAAQGEQVRLVWQGRHIQSCKLEGKAVPESGTMPVYPLRATTYLILCTGAGGGDAMDSVVVRWRGLAVSEEPPPGKKKQSQPNGLKALYQ
ncbi:pectate lyase [Sphingobium sp. SCG-1]|uniref:pectate lyase n=1 Tax=Sphingobium sp. SCG-1 TaxID=2072936 RepID=UPI000CD6A23D|nr:pectate lyase [Sphingobium sp. SCG-1]AUW57389.1 pectate lyase [Sphingobium sp. SCG-1]